MEKTNRSSLIPIPALNERHRIRCENGTVVAQSLPFALSSGKHPSREGGEWQTSGGKS